MLATQQLSTPLWTWVFFGLVLLAIIFLMGYALRKVGGARSMRGSRASGKGLTPEQLAFQEEMRLMLSLRMAERVEDAPDDFAPPGGEEPRADRSVPAEEPGAGTMSG